MIFRLMLKGLRHGKARFLCAVAGLAISVGVVVFTTSLVATSRAQAPELAKRACVPWSAWRIDGIQLRERGRPPRGGGREGARPARGAESRGVDRQAREARRGKVKADLRLQLLQLTIDYRPDGRVLQGPPMMALMANAPAESPYGIAPLVEGRWVDDSSAELEVVCTRTTMRRFGRGKVPALGEKVKFVGRKGTMTAKVVGYLAEVKLPRGWPGVFANRAALAAFAQEERGEIAFWRKAPGEVPDALTATSEQVVAGFKGDEQRRLDYATPLMLLAAVLTALSLLVNSLLLSVESNRSTLSMLRTLGLTRLGVVRFVMEESFFAGMTGWLLGAGCAVAALYVYVGMDRTAFPVGMALGYAQMAISLVLLIVVALLAVLFALRPALAVRPMDAVAQPPRSRRRGMAVTFACGFAAFVAVEVWGASLMRGFIPSLEWPDAIVSLLPEGVSSWDVEKLRKLEGVKRISELVPRQAMIAGFEEPSRNALFLGAEWLPRFKFLEGTWEEATKALASSDAVVITEMMSRAHQLHKGDRIKVRLGGRRGEVREESFPIAGVVDLNWHMVTSRGLVRGLNGMSGMTDGPVFASLDTLGVIDPRTYMTEPAMSANMTHLWVEYEPVFLAQHGVFPAGRRIERSIDNALGNPTGCTVRLHARDEIADGTLAHGSDVIGQAARVPFIFLFVLAIGFVAMLVAEADARRREFAVLRAVGATRSQLAASLGWSAVKTALWGIAWGLPSGSLAGWLFSLKTGNWPGMPHYFVLPWEVVLEGAVGAVAFALVFAVPTAVLLVARRRGV